jgi:hypothetical protein
MRWTRALLASFLAFRVLAGHKEAAAAKDAARELYAGASAQQLEYLDSSEQRRKLTGSRRSGKTEVEVIELVAVAARGQRVLYLSLTALLAEETVWERLIERLDQLGLQYIPNTTKRTLRLAGGGLIKLGGMKDRKEIDKHRGKAWALVIIDECGAQPSDLLKYCIESSIGPTLLDHGGRLTLSGTPSVVLSGYWFDQAGPDHVDDPNRWEWFIHDNPFFVGRADRVLRSVLEENEWEETCITYRREYLGEWVQDDSVLVYPYDRARNGIESLPERTPKGYPIDPRRWRHAIGLDVGTTKDAMAIVVLAVHPALAGEYMVHAEAHTAMLTDALVARLRALLQRFPKATVVIDSAASGMHLELQAVGLPVVGAKKVEKALAIRVLHDRVLGGRFKLLLLPALDGVRAEWRKLGWDDDHLQHHEAQSDHYSDATLYALRELRHYHSKEDMAKPPRDERNVDVEEDEDERQVAEQQERTRERSWSHRLRLVVGPLAQGLASLGHDVLVMRPRDGLEVGDERVGALAVAA